MDKESLHLVRYASDGLSVFLPGFSASGSLTAGQKCVLILIPMIFLAVFFFMPSMVLAVFIFIGLICLLSALLRYVPILIRSPFSSFSFEKKEAEDEVFPIYTILVPLFDEANMVPHLIDHLRALNWPRDRLDIKLILEDADESTRAAVEALNLGAPFEVIIVPDYPPRTKAKACNYALFSARGMFVTIYDAEDRPDPNQLRHVWDIFRSSSPQLACLQAPLNFFNADENWLTRQFAIEYTLQFMFFLPFVVRMNLPVFLGGSSNHFRMDALRRLYGWDAYNVTEDADIGLRLARFGFSCAMAPSLTMEEAACRSRDWLGQRTRWIKGWLQTWLVATRAPFSLIKEIGFVGFIFLQLLVPVYILALFVHLLIWPILLAIAFYDSQQAMWIALVVCASYAIMILIAQYGCRHSPLALARPLAGQCWMIPAYWMLMGFAACRAVFHLIVKPYYWNKTPHGVSMWPRAQNSGAKTS